MELAEAKLYLRVDGTADDDTITGMITAAAKYIDGQTGKTEVKTGTDTWGAITADALYILANKIMIAHWYENRGIVTPGTVNNIPRSADAIINHIAMCGDYR